MTALLALGVVVGLVTAVWQRWRRGEVFSWRLAGALLAVGVVAVVTSLALVFSWSRGAWLSFGAGTAVLILFWPQKLWQGLLLLAVGGMLFLGGVRAGVVPASVTERITSFSQDLRLGDVRGEDINDANYAVLERLAHWQAAVDMARENLWLGVGFGNYEPAYADYALLNWPYPLGHAHNYYLNLAAEVGVVGLLAYLVLWTAVFWQTIRLLRRLDWPARGIALGLLAVWAAISVHHLVDKLYVNNIYIHLGVMLGLLQLLEIGDWRLEIGD
ncbi:MAG TPA: O-antigen ligase domain-containing protein [Chloroflexi bacterium]|nr:O-antigen ligase domain-containing protein [Chloroflexota bacterium]